MIKHILKYGVIFGILCATSGFSFYISGNYGKYRTLHFFILLTLTISSIFYALNSFKNKNKENLNLTQALIVGIGISIFGGLIPTIWEIVLIKIIEPEIITQIIDDQFKRLTESSSDLNEAAINRKIVITKNVKSPIGMLTIGIIEDLIVGFFISLIIGLILRKKQITLNNISE
ncbi:DUF4199 domain-containing protein [Aquimarina litoralis]|uniref:DUF4199 domain-containing protein n=1 Tax=Aquimarina litoralis TaxID=584605 RepID=UPI001C559734|nr:DUF4199 domain-containing protein [Aquimarina litoralis]